MQQPSPILVYSIYRSDIPRFERLLARALPDVSIHCASSLEEAAPYLDEAVILYGWGFPPELPQRMQNLRWLQKMGAGVDEIIERWPLRANVILTRTAGKLIAPRMVEYVLGAILDRTLRFDAARAQQQRRQWEFFEIGSIRNLTIGVAGAGEIGSIVAQNLRALGARVLGWRLFKSRFAMLTGRKCSALPGTPLNHPHGSRWHRRLAACRSAKYWPANRESCRGAPEPPRS